MSDKLQFVDVSGRTTNFSFDISLRNDKLKFVGHPTGDWIFPTRIAA